MHYDGNMILLNVLEDQKEIFLGVYNNITTTRFPLSALFYKKLLLTLHFCIVYNY